MTQQTWFMVPVRGGSTRLPGKNAKYLGDKPLMCYTVDTLKTVVDPDHIIVSTDDDELAAIAEERGVRVVRRPTVDGVQTLDDAALQCLPFLEIFGAKDEDIFLTIQATCPFVTAATVQKAMDTMKQKGGSVITVMDDRHLNWTMDDNGNASPLYEARVNSQQLPPNFRESGAVIGSTIALIKQNSTRINEPINLIEITKKEGLDIDDYKDWVAAEYYVHNKKIIIRADASKTMGMGHVYRSIALANELVKHNPILVTKVNGDGGLGRDFLSQFPFQLETVNSNDAFVKYAQEQQADCIILDQLSTDKDYIEALRGTGAKIITFEDMGDGAPYADLVVNDLYKIPGISEDKQLYGVDSVFLPRSFRSTRPNISINRNVKNIVIIFGGADPSGLTTRSLQALQAIKFDGEVTVVQGLGHSDVEINLDDYGLKGEVRQNVTFMPGLMKQADLALSSGGRTVTELMALGVPTMCVCQNERELTHSHASSMYGVHNIGLGSLIGDSTIQKNLKFLIDTPQVRENMNIRARDAMAHHSNEAVMKRIMERVGVEF